MKITFQVTLDNLLYSTATHPSPKEIEHTFEEVLAPRLRSALRLAPGETIKITDIKVTNG